MVEHCAATDADSGVAGRWSRRRTVALVAVVVLLALVWSLSGRFVALVVVADGLGFDPPRPFASEVERRVEQIGDVEVDRYEPQGDDRAAGDVPAILLVPGATPAGRDDSRVVDVATAIAAVGRTVVVPELEVYDEDLVPADIDRLVIVGSQLGRRHGAVSIAGLSFGGSLALVAAAEERLADHVALVATFGAYADLAGVAQAATTGVSLVDGERIPWDPDPRAADVVRDQVLGLLPADDARTVEQALAGDRPLDELRAELRAVHDFIVHDDPTRTEALVAAMPEVIRTRIEVVSPARLGADLEADVLALHARDDPVIPFGELRRLEVTFPQVDSRTLVTFDHVGIDDDHGWWVTVRDLWTTSGFLHELLDAEREEQW